MAELQLHLVVTLHHVQHLDVYNYMLITNLTTTVHNKLRLA